MSAISSPADLQIGKVLCELDARYHHNVNLTFLLEITLSPGLSSVIKLDYSLMSTLIITASVSSLF